MAELEHNSACSEDTNSLCDEERVRKLFEACDADGDGFIDSEDLLTVCRELNLEDSLEELMKELGADENGRISYKEFLQRRLALRPEIDALRSTPCHRHQQDTATPDYLPTSSDNSLGGASGGKCGGESSWEFDSGARDLSPEPNTLQRLVEAAGCSLTATNTASLLQLANKLHLAALASLRGEILELSSRLHTVTEEREASERAAAEAAQQYEERITELHCVIAELSRKVERQRSLVITEEDDVPSETEQSVETCSQAEAEPEVEVDDPKESALAFDDAEAEEVVTLKKEKKSALDEECAELRVENCELREQLRRVEAELRQTTAVLDGVREDRERLRTKLRESPRVASSPPPPLPRDQAPVLKVAERVRLRRLDRHVTGSDLASLGVSRTEVAEQLVAGVRGQCDREEAGLEVECERQTARLEHARAHITTLQLALDDTKAQCERLSLLVGKYESNVTASRLALNSCDRAIDAYDLLVSLLQRSTSEEDRSPEERQLRRLISDLRAERALVGGTVVELESLTEQPPPSHPHPHRPTPALSRKLDLETAVLMQELMAMREDKAELRARVHLLERERESGELRVATLHCQQQAHLATIQHLQARLDQLDAGADDMAAPQQEEGGECGEGREGRLRDRLKEVTSTLERVSRNAELRQRQAAELANELKTANSGLVQSLERSKRKSQARLRKLDTQMLAMVERHAAQVRTLKQRIAVLEEAREQHNRQSQGSAASETSL